MPIAREVVLHVAELSSLSLEEGEVDALAGELDAIVRYVEQLGAVETEGVEPATFGAALAPRGALRPDVPAPGLSHEDALAGAPASAEDGFAVPLFVES
ncbi:MAG TPA: Asp-tRNA(Asn)/Glu-tRNA(Gln) amidotransferase subunit GatC [Polyangiaceae bacterium]|jgi:aspartyl-tRNA(Asn)/glutamyl-tRNA(Gln) amidotransferase subunit C